MSTDPRGYTINLDDKHGRSALVDIPAEHQGYTVPRGVVHHTRAPVKTVILMVENAGVAPTGD
jgi:hypothetical protein